MENDIHYVKSTRGKEKQYNQYKKKISYNELHLVLKVTVMQ